MNKINKVLIAFMVLVFAVSVSIWSYLHSEAFAKKITGRINSIVKKEAGITIDFNHASISVFPPATSFHQFSMRRENIQVEAQKVNVVFSFLDFFRNQLRIDSLEIENAHVAFKSSPSEEKFKLDDLNSEKFFETYREILSKIPVSFNLIKITSGDLKIDENELKIKKLAIAPTKREIKIGGDLEQVLINEKQLISKKIKLDKIHLQAYLNKRELKFEKLKFFYHGQKFEGDANLVRKELSLNSEMESSFAAISDDIDILKKYLGDVNGKIMLKISGSGNLRKNEFDLDVNVTEFKSKWMDAKQVLLGLKLKNNQLVITKGKVQTQRGVAIVKTASPLFDLKNLKLIPGKSEVQVSHLESHEALKAIENILDPLYFKLTGLLDINWSMKEVSFFLKPGTQIQDFKLHFKDSKTPILKNNGFTSEGLDIKLLLPQFDVKIFGNVQQSGSVIKTAGDITSKGVDFNISAKSFDLKKFGPISGVDLYGIGDSEINIHGPFEDVIFEFHPTLKNASVLGYELGNVKGNISYSLHKSDLIIDSIEGEHRNSQYKGSTRFHFGSDSQFEINLSEIQSTYLEALSMVKPISEHLPIPKDMDFKLKGGLRVGGAFDVHQMYLDSQIKGEDLKYKGEEFDYISFNMKLKNSLFQLRDIKIQKGQSVANALLSYDLKDRFLEIEGGASGLKLNDLHNYRKLNLGYNGDVNLDFDGNGNVDDFSSRFRIKVNNAHVGSIPAPGSNFVVYYDGKEAVIQGSAIGNKVKIDSSWDLTGKKKDSKLEFTFDTNEVRELLGVLSEHNILDKQINGKVKAKLQLEIDSLTYDLKKFAIDFSDFYLQKNDFYLVVDREKNQAIIENGAIKNWDLSFRTNNGYIKSTAKDEGNGVVRFSQDFNFDAKLFEFVNPLVEKTNGTIRGTNTITFDKGFYVNSFYMFGTDINVRLFKVPAAIENLNFVIRKSGKDYKIENFQGQFGGGIVRADGFWYFDDIFPEMNVNLSVENATLNLFKKTKVLLSGQGKITGSNLPYLFTGKVSSKHGEIFDDPNELAKEFSKEVVSENKFLPKKALKANREILHLNLNAEIGGPFIIKNNLAELNVTGSALLTGNMISPKINARFETTPNTSKFKFKGHDFIVSQGVVELSDGPRGKDSDVKFVATSKISEYDLKIDVSGKVEKANINLSSEPALGQDDLLSLLTLGVTNDMSKNLESSERRFVTTMGLGTLLVDQLKINEDLNSSLGLKLSVVPEFQEDESSLVSGKSAVSEGSSSKLKSATKIQVQKKITKNVDLSVSSTVGGSIEQKQEMNVNMKINKNLSLEGVYEIKSNEEDTEQNNKSMGADLKYRWSF